MPIRLLLIEDNPGDAVIFREKIGASDLDATLVHVTRLGDGLEALETGAFDLLLVDLSLPDAHGLDSVDKVRKAAPHLPLIVLTGLDDAAVAADAKKRGAVDYLVKWYVDSISLARYIRYAIEQYRIYGDEMKPVSAAALVVEPETVVEARVEEKPEKTEPGSGTDLGLDPSLLLQAVEAARQYVQDAVRLGQHLDGTLRAALDSVRSESEGEASRAEPQDVVALVRQATERSRERAQRFGVPLRVAASRKKVVADIDRSALNGYLDRLIDLALATAQTDGLEFSLDAEPARVVLVGTWPLRRGVDLTQPDDEPLYGLDLALCRRLAARAGGTFTFAAANAHCEATLTLRARTHA